MNYDAIVVGGGIIGVSIAYSLAQRQFGRVALLERSNLGMGSTGTSVASIEPLGRFPCMSALQHQSIHVFKHFHDLFGADCGFVSLPLAMFIHPDHQPLMSEIAACSQAAGSDARLLTPDEFEALHPGASFDGVAAVYYSHDAGHADPILTLNAYADAARQLDVVIRQDTPVTGLQVEGGRVTGVHTPGGMISAPVIVLAAGLWIESLLKPLGLTASLHLHRHFVVCIEAPDDAPHLSVIDTVLEFYSRPERAGNVYLLGGSGDFPPCSDPDSAPPGVTMDCSFTYLERLVERFPVMEASRLRPTTAYTGIADLTPDRHPLLGALPVEGLYLAAGMSGIGFKIAPGVGQAMAGLIAGDPTAAALLHPLRPSRISEGQLLKSHNELSVIV